MSMWSLWTKTRKEHLDHTKNKTGHPRGSDIRSENAWTMLYLLDFLVPKAAITIVTERFRGLLGRD